MTPHTHVVLALVLGKFSGASPTTMTLLSIGAVLPDIDHQQASISKIFPFISTPLSVRYGHRKEIHSLFLWGLVCICGIYWQPLLFIGLGALSHCFIDCWTVSGTSLLAPFSERICVFFQRKYRILVGSRGEYIFFVFLLIAFWMGCRVESAGGSEAVVGNFLGSFQIASERYTKAGLKVCHLEGKLRLANGQILSDRWLVIGREKTEGLAILFDDKLLHLPTDGRFIRSKLYVDDSKKWMTANIKGLAEISIPVYCLRKGRWSIAKKGSLVSGTIIGERIEVNPVGGVFD